MTSKRMEYKGDLVDKLMALSDCGSGGQVIIDGATLEQLADKTFSIARLVPPIDLAADITEPSRYVQVTLPWSYLAQRLVSVIPLMVASSEQLVDLDLCFHADSSEPCKCILNAHCPHLSPRLKPYCKTLMISLASGAACK